MWHASIAILDAFGYSIDTYRWPSDYRVRAQRIATELLEGVGQEPTRIDDGHIVIHVRRSITDAEIAGMDPAWLAIPAVDMG